MKKLILPVVAVIALMTMSFTTNTSKVQIVKTENGAFLTNPNLLTVEDLSKMSVIGIKHVFIFHTSHRSGDTQETVVASVTLSNDQEEKLNEILAKY